MGSRGFWQELKRRHVYRVAAAYAVVGWLLIQVATQVFPIFHFPDWVDQAVVLLILVGFPIALMLAWAFDATPMGIVRADVAPESGVENPVARRRSRRIGAAIGVMGVVLAVIAGVAWWHLRAPRVHPSPTSSASAVRSPDGAQRYPGNTTPTSATAAKTAPDTAAEAAGSGLHAASTSAAQPISAKSVAVLPFENLSTDKGNAYFADGMQDLILTKLADIGDLKVISRTSTEKYKSHPDDLKTIGDQLGVATILEGSVQKAGNQVLINVQLIDAKTDSHIWAESYTRTLDNIFGVEGEVATKVADALKAKLTPVETARVAQVPTTNTAAYNAFLRGMYYSDHSFIPNSQKLAIGYYRQAVAQDPHFVSAWVHLAILLSDNARDSGSRADAEQAKSALDHALALAPDSPDVRMAQGWYLDYVKKDLDGALAAFHAVAVSQPNNAQALFGVGVMCAHKGQWDDAIGSLQKAIALAPKSKEILGELMTAYQALHRYPDAVRIAQRRVAVDPSDGSGIAELMGSYALMGDLGRALATYEKAPASARANPYLTYVYAGMQISHRNYAVARKLLATLQPVAGLSMRTIEVMRGDVEQFAGDTALARTHYLHAKALYEADLKQSPDSPGARLDFAWVLAQLGQRNEALAQAALGIREDNAQRQFDPFKTECEDKLSMAQFQAVLRNAGTAVESLDWLLARPTGGHISVPMLKLDPTWDPIRKDPRFQALLKKYAQPAPASAASVVPPSAISKEASDG